MFTLGCLLIAKYSQFGKNNAPMLRMSVSATLVPLAANAATLMQLTQRLNLSSHALPISGLDITANDPSYRYRRNSSPFPASSQVLLKWP